jgi:glutamate/tyrosine decarboxylase-like PLP-dependent enzyme
MGLGARAIRWIPTDAEQRMDVAALRRRLREDREAGRTPFMAIGTAGTVSTGAIDPLREIAAVCREHALWFHVDGAYGAPAAALPEADADLRALAEADSVAFDPHKWLYAPLEAGCVLVRDAEALHDTFHHRPPYYHFGGEPDDMPTNLYEWGPQNSRGFRALKVWLVLQQVGRAGYVGMIRDDIALARAMFDHARTFPELETATCRLSIATFRYIPADLRPRVRPADAGRPVEPNDDEAYVDRLNTELLTAMQDEGEAYLSNAVIGGRFHLRACIVNFRTTLDDVRMVPELAVRMGRAVDARLREKR